jgi:predicted AAA+ superfamily ATPase
MIDVLRDIQERLLGALAFSSHRFVFDAFDLEPRLIGLVGPRGVGKTTVLLQLIKEKLLSTRDAFYVSADHIYFTRIGLFDFVRDVYETDGITRFFVDEVHKYNGWAQEIKNIYDSFPDVRIVFSGSSSLSLVKGSYDLSRRALLRHLPGLSFREYLNFRLGTRFAAVSYEDILRNDEPFREVVEIKGLRGYFNDYLERGYYPFALEGPDYFFDKIRVVVDKTIYEDIANFFPLKTENLRLFKKLLTYLATIPPGALNTHSLARNLGVDDKTADRYLTILIDTGLARALPAAKRGSSPLRKAEKLFLDNPSLHHAMAHELDQPPDAGTLRELFFLNTTANAGIKATYGETIGDVRIGKHSFEIGGRGKGRQQLRGATGDAFVVKDEILTGHGMTIPLYRFGFLY